MDFGWINIFGIIIVVIMLIPNVVYAIKCQNKEDKYSNKIMNIVEQIGRYGSMIFMVIGTLEFSSVSMMLIYLIGNAILLFGYFIIWILYLKKETVVKSMLLAIIPALIFLISGITLKYLLLIIFAVVFGCSHIFITYKNNIGK